MKDWVELRAGPLAMWFDPAWGSLRRVRLGDREVLRAIYGAVRDAHWGTVRPVISNVAIERRDEGFSVAFEADCRQGEIDFAWRGTITGQADGTVNFVFEGAARSAFRTNRVGLCVLHPVGECAGQPCVVHKTDGSAEETRFPYYISPEVVFRDVRAISHEVAAGMWAEVRLEGDVFETEDQRNWTDASFKTYSRPLDLPRPYELAPGQAVRQVATLTLRGQAEASRRSGPVEVAVGGRPAVQLPRIGLAVASHDQPLDPRERNRLKALALSHLRVELRLAEDDWPARLERAARQAEAIGAALEVALFVPEDQPDALLRALKTHARKLQPRVAWWFVLPEGERATTPPGLVPLARSYLETEDRQVLFGGGTNRYFTELNRARPPAEELDVVCYSFNPQVHTFDDDSLMETPEGQAWTVRTAQQFAQGRPIAISPITLRPRAGGSAPPGELPPQVDPRQATLFCAAWTVASVAALAASGAHSATFYETTGWLGVMETARGCPLPDKFPSKPATVFPVYHVLADLGEFARGEVVPVSVEDPLAVAVLAVQKRGRTRLLGANLTDLPQVLRLENIPAMASLLRLNDKNIRQASRAPEVFRAAAPEVLTGSGGVLELQLAPYEVVRLDF